MYEGNITSIAKYFNYSKIITTPTPNPTLAYMGAFTDQMINLRGVRILLTFPEFLRPKDSVQGNF